MRLSRDWGRLDMSSEGWVKTTLGEVYDFSSGLSKNAKEFGFGYPFLSFKTVFNNYFIPQSIKELANTNEREQGKYSIKKGDVFLTRTSETLDELGMSCVALKDYPTATFNGFTKRLRPKVMNVIDEKYAGYYFRSQKFRDTLTSMATISTRASLNNDILKRLQIILPSLKEQSEIGNVLYCLDNKIELNTRINKNLEEMAQAIFKSWFIDFEPFQDGEFEDSELGRIPKGWRVGCVGDISDVFSGKRPIVKQDIQSEEMPVPVIGASCIMAYTNDILFDERIIITGRVGTHGVIQRFSTPCWASDNTLIIKSKKYEFVYQILKGVDYKSMNRGSTQPLITKTDLKNIKIIIPIDTAMEEFENMVGSIMKIWGENITQNCNLKNIRDTLLPKLMSGEIEVPIEEVH